MVGVKAKNDPEGKIFTPVDALALENPIVSGLGVMGTKGAVLI